MISDAVKNEFLSETMETEDSEMYVSALSAVEHLDTPRQERALLVGAHLWQKDPVDCDLTEVQAVRLAAMFIGNHLMWGNDDPESEATQIRERILGITEFGPNREQRQHMASERPGYEVEQVLGVGLVVYRLS